MKIFLMLILMLSQVGFEVRAAEILPTYYNENLEKQKIPGQRKFSHTALLTANPMGSGSQGYGYRIGYTSGIKTIDLGVHYSRAAFGSVTTENLPTAELTSELEMPRNYSDSWTMLVFESGLTVRGRIFPYTQKRWSNYGRFSVGFTNLYDKPNKLAFNGWIFGFEGGAEYLISKRVGLVPFIMYRFGYANRDTPTDSGLNHRRILLSNIQAGIGLNFLFF